MSEDQIIAGYVVARRTALCDHGHEASHKSPGKNAMRRRWDTPVTMAASVIWGPCLASDSLVKVAVCVAYPW